jgi:hypothetical protein
MILGEHQASELREGEGRYKSQISKYKEHDNLFTGVWFPKETYVSIEVSQRTDSLSSLSSDSKDRA